MKNKYRSGYAEGGFLDDGAAVDSVSGNDVPAGSLQEEVRDDVPAQLSEGEFVVPADVVRFIGLDKLMKMRDQAKSGLARMEDEGQIGGAPTMTEGMPQVMSEDMYGDDPEMDALIDGMDSNDFESSATAFAEGGFVQTEDGRWIPKGATTEAVSTSYEDMMGRGFGSVPTTETLVYINEEGHKVYIPVVDGEPAYAPPEGYTLVLDEDVVEEEVVEDTTGEAAVVPDTSLSEKREKQQAVADLSESDKLSRDRYKSIESQASSDMSQEGIDKIWGQMTQQEKTVYEQRMQDPKWIDKFMTDGMAPVDRMLAAIQTVNAENIRKGLSIRKSDTSTFSDESIDFKELLKVVGKAAVVGIPGMMSATMVKKLGADSDEVLSAAEKFLKGLGDTVGSLGEGSGRTGSESIQPTVSAPQVYDQKYWKENFYDKGLGNSSKLINEQKLEIARDTGLNAYGNELTKSEVDQLNEMARIQDLKDKNARTIEKRRIEAEQEDNRIKAQQKADKDAQDRADYMAQQEADKVAKQKADAERVRIANEQEDNRIKAQQKADKDAQDRANYRAQQEADKPTPTPTKTVTSDSARRSVSAAPTKTVTSDSARRSVSAAPSHVGYSQAAQQAASTSSQAARERSEWNVGGLATKKNRAPVKKMRSDPTAGLASKKKAKQKAQAKKGALAAKRT